MKLYIVLPIYNIEVNNDVINTEIIGGYKLITNETFFNKYKKEIIFDENTDVYHSLEEDISSPQSGMPFTRSLAKHVLIKEFEVEGEYPSNKELFNSFIDKEKAMINRFILLLRLIQNGRCQFNSFYIFANSIYARFFTGFSTNINDIRNFLVTSEEEILNEKNCLFSKEIVDKLNQANSIFIPSSREEQVPIMYFMQYYNTNNMFDRIIKLAIVLESSVLAGIQNELSYRLRIRVSAFLKQDCKDILNIFYTLRSGIVHNGTVEKKSFSDIRKVINNEKCSDIKAIFVFLRDYMEPIVRNVLYKSFETFEKDRKIKNYNELFSSVDDEIFKKITE